MGQHNILLVANYPSDVGYAWWLMENFWVSISNHFKSKGQKCFLIYPKINKLPSAIESAPITVIEHDFSDVSKKSNDDLCGIIKRNNITNLYLTDQAYVSSRYRQLRKYGIKTIVMHDHMPGERTKPDLFRFVTKKILNSLPGKTCDLYVGVSKFVYNRFINNVLLPAKKCAYVTNGIIPINLDDPDIKDVHKEFSLDENTLVAVTIARATIYKGIDFIIESLNRLVNEEKITNLRVLYIGDGPAIDDFKKLVAEYGLQKYFIFAGRRNDVRLLLPSCDIALHASKGEAFSLAILEYLSAGLASIIPDNCGNNEAIEHNSTGILYKTGDISEMTAYMKQIVQDERFRKQLGENATASVLQKFTLERANRELVDLLETVFV